VSTTPRPRRGRPPKTSLEDLVDKAIELMAAEPDRPLSLNALARAAGITPMAIYRYAADRDELLQAVAERLLGDLNPKIPDADWETQLSAWAFAMRDYFLKNPALFTILGWQQHVARPWLSQLAGLARILQRAGLKGRALADAVQWVSSTIISAVYMEIAARRSGSRVSASDLRSLPEEDAVLMAEVVQHLKQKSARAVFTDCVERILIIIKGS